MQDLIKKHLAGELPKWPQMFVTGKPVTRDLAKEIIFRTDDFLTGRGRGGGAEAFNKRYKERSGLKKLESLAPVDPETGRKDLGAHFDNIGYLGNALGCVGTSYVENDWASCSFVDGPHGWCSPEGKIFFQDNVGKWPEPEDLLSDWQAIASAFPFLDLNVTIMSESEGYVPEEYGEDASPIRPLLNIRVVSGEATPCAPDLSVHTEPRSNRPFAEDSFVEVSSLGLPPSWYEEFCQRVKEAVNKLIADKQAQEGKSHDAT